VADPNDDHHNPIVVHSIKDSVISDPQSPSAVRSTQQFRAGRSGIDREGVDCARNAPAHGLRQSIKLASS
jgi:hypothetical protein